MSGFTTREHHADPLWVPDHQALERSAMARFMRTAGRDCEITLGCYQDLWEWSVGDLDAFWATVARFFDVDVVGASGTVLADPAMPGASWFPGASLNYAQYALRPGGAPAIIPVGEDGPGQPWSREQLRAHVAGLAQHLRAAGVRPGDRVAGYLPNIPEAVVAFLAAASVGAIWSLCGPELGTASVVSRFAQLEPAVLVAADSHLYGGRRHDRRRAVADLQAALPSLSETIVIADEVPAGMTAWHDAAAPADDLQIEPLAFDHPLWVLFSSGSTGAPKGIVHGHGGIVLEHLKFLGLHVDLGPGDRFLWQTSTSWMMWNVVVSALMTGATIVLYNGSPNRPGPDRLLHVAAGQAVTVLGTSAAYLTECTRRDVRPPESLRRSLRALHSTGSPLPAAGYYWARDHLGASVPVISGSGGTDVASGLVGGSPLLPVYAGELSGPCLGAAVQAWDEQARPVRGQVGELVVTQPMPTMPLRLWNDPGGHRYRASYFGMYPGIWRQGDWIEFTDRGTAIIYGRSDATLNRSGIRIGTAEIYQVVESLPEIAEALVIGVEEEAGGYWMPLFVHLAPGARLDEDLRASIKTAIARQASARHVPDDIIEVSGIPHTLTGKKLEVPVKGLLQSRDIAIDKGAIDDHRLLEQYREIARLRRRPPG